MAARYARLLADETVEVFCAGTKELDISKYANLVMNDVNLPIENERTLPISEAAKMPFDTVVTLCDSAYEKCPLFPGSPARIDWGLTDPMKLVPDGKDPTEYFVRLRDEIRDRVRALFEHGYIHAIMRQRFTFNSLLNNMADGVMAHDSKRKIFYFNEAARKITGFSYSEVIGKDCHKIFPQPFCGVSCGFCTDKPDVSTKLHYSTTFHRKDGKTLDLEVSMIAIEDNSDATQQGGLIIFRDLTEMNKLKRKIEQGRGYHGIIGRHDSMQKIFNSIQELADVNVPILVQGESGTGKEVVANALHDLSNRADQPFVPVNCGALPEGTLESELFGHVKGAFTSAHRDKKGRFELAHNGTIFLDEISEVSQATQVKLLRVLQEKSFVPVGGEKEVKVNVRVICATNDDLKKLTQEGKFREDLYYRLVVVPILLPPLRDRKSDIPLLVDHFLEQYSSETGKMVTSVNSDALEILEAYSWPGNVRELSNAIQYSLIKCQGYTLQPNHLPPEVINEVKSSMRRGPGRPPKLSRQKVEEALSRTGGNLAKAATLLGVSRPTLYRVLKKSDPVT
ncbi:sigma 54-interacting transcriptional regulator [bacterium]|nr:sigma 54-interacting transcriptional regulator [bacterium]